jgi:hypothetical protein
MSAIVVFESMFGNTREIAEAIAEGLRAAAVDAATMEVGSAPDRFDEAVGMVIVGGPTHAFGMTRPGTRESARQQADRPTVSQGVGLREWLESFLGNRPELLTATFDTRIAKVRHLPGSAARGAAKLLRKQGHRVVVAPESFYVSVTMGPLLEGERERAPSLGRESRPRV